MGPPAGQAGAETTVRQDGQPGWGRPPRGGFSLIELLTAVAALAVVIAVLAGLFSGMRHAWYRGQGRAANNAAGRAALALMARDLGDAVADERLSFAVLDERSAPPSYDFTNSVLAFASLQPEGSATNRAAQGILYWVRPADAAGLFDLVRGRVDGARCYADARWYDTRPGSPDLVAGNVAGLRVVAPAADGSWVRLVESNRLPACVDVYLEILDEDAAREAAALSQLGSNVTDLVERSAVRYTTRVFLQNRRGYEPR
jgi:prepilin-type N-terminal cleavage/methylation domain-containing protein